MSYSTTPSGSEKRPVSHSVEKILGGWQFIWYDYEDHAPDSVPIGHGKDAQELRLVDTDTASADTAAEPSEETPDDKAAATVVPLS